MMDVTHIGEAAELYALGLLSQNEAASIDDHARGCERCAQRLGEAEAVVAATIRPRDVPPALGLRVARLRSRPDRTFERAAALAAAVLVLALLPFFIFWQSMRSHRDTEAMQQRAALAMVGSHFLHTPFTKLTPDAPMAKAIFARNGRWIYVVAQSNEPLEVVAAAGASRLQLGTLKVTGNVAQLFVEPSRQARFVLLMQGDRTLARAAIVRGGVPP